MSTETIKPAKPRILWMDAARFIAIWLVVLTHTREIGSMVPYSLYDATPWLWQSIINNIDRLGVPIFLIISGALTLRRAGEMPVGEYFRKYAGRIVQFVLLLAFYSILTNFVSRMVLHGEGAWDALCSAACENNGVWPLNYGDAYHMWYMHAIIAMYLVAPFIGRMLKHMETREILCFLALIFAFNYMRHWGGIFGDINNTVGPTVSESQLFSSATNMLQSGMPGGFLMYFILGYLLMHRNLVPENARTTRLAAAVFVGSCLLATGVDLIKGHHVYFLHWYCSSVTVLAGGFAVVVLLRNLLSGISSLPGIVMATSKHSFGIYLTHYAIIFAILPWWQQQPHAQNCVVSCLFYTAFCFPLSMLLTWLLARSRKSRYLVA